MNVDAAESHVLVVDDEQDVRDTLCEVVEMAGCRALSAANGVEALRVLAHRRPCTIVIDLMMPDMTGDELVEAIRSRPDLARLPLLVCTSAPSNAPEGVAVLAKLVDIAALWNWIRQNCNCVKQPCHGQTYAGPSYGRPQRCGARPATNSMSSGRVRGGDMKRFWHGCAPLLVMWWPLQCDTTRLSPLTRLDGGVARLAMRISPDPIRIEVLDPDQQPPTFVMRGQPKGPGRLVFLHGMCGHGLGYAQSFQFSASKWGTLIAPQGDVICGTGPWARWSSNLTTLNDRIDDAFRALGASGPIEEITVIGYSQGATRAEALVRKWPSKYTRLVLMAAPQAPSTQGLSELRAAVTMAGQRDRQDLMKAGARSLRAVGVPAKYLMIPEATHGSMGPTPEQTMGDALSWLYEQSKTDP